MIDFFSADLERKRVKIRVKGTVSETYGAFGPHSHRLIKQIGVIQQLRGPILTQF